MAACRVYVTVTEPLPVDRHGDSRAAASPVDAPSMTAGHLGRGDTDYFRVRVERTSYLEAATTGSTDTAAVLQDRWGHAFAADDDTGAERISRSGIRLQPTTTTYASPRAAAARLVSADSLNSSRHVLPDHGGESPST